MRTPSHSLVCKRDDGILFEPDVCHLHKISDDNFRFFQRTEIVEYRIPD